MNIFDENILINDSGIHHLGTKAPLVGKPWEEWKLADFLEEMRRWPGSANQLGLKKYGHQKLAVFMRDNYEILAAWLELSLRGKEELREVLFCKKLLPLRAAAKLSAASRFFISEHLWDRIQGKVKNKEYWWSPLAHTPDHLWSAYEYSLCFRELDEHLQGKAPKNKPAFLKEIRNFNHLELKFIEECNQAEAQISRLLPEKIREQEIHFQQVGLTAMTQNPSLSGRTDPRYCELRQALCRQVSQVYREKTIEIAKQKLEIASFNELEQQFHNRRLEQIYQTSNWAYFYKFLMLEAQYFILFKRDRNLKAHYEQYLHEWFIYHDAMKNSASDWQIYYLLSPDLDPVSSKVGRPPKAKDKRTTSNKGRGRPSKGQERNCKDL